MNLLRKLRRDQRGAAVIELAIAAPVLAMLVIGMSDITIAYGRELDLEQGAQRAIEKVMQTTGDQTVEDAIKNEAVCQVNGTNSGGTCKSAPITTANVTVTYRLECMDGGTVASSQETTDSTEFSGFSCDEGQTAANYLRVKVTDQYTPMFAMHFGTDADGTYHLSATAGIRTQ
jgi:Flp pilus assembly protein TadG